MSKFKSFLKAKTKNNIMDCTNSLQSTKSPHFSRSGKIGQLSKKERALCWSFNNFVFNITKSYKNGPVLMLRNILLTCSCIGSLGEERSCWSGQGVPPLSGLTLLKALSHKIFIFHFSLLEPVLRIWNRRSRIILPDP